MSCASSVQNFRPSTERPGCPRLPPTGSVDKKTGLTCMDGVIHGFHRPYYYSHSELTRNPLRRRPCAQLGPGAFSTCDSDLTRSRTDCRCRASDWSPASQPTTKASRASQQQQEAVPVKIRVERDVLAEAVAWVARSLPARPPAPVLAGLLLKAEDGALSFSSFDYEVSARVSVDAEVEEDGTVLVSGRPPRRHLPGPAQPPGRDLHRRCTGDRGLRFLAVHAPHPSRGRVPRAAADADGDGHRPR